MSLSELAVFQCFCKPLSHIHTHTHWSWPSCTTWSECGAGLMHSTGQTVFFFFLLLISLKNQTKSFPPVSPVSLNTIWWWRTAETELKKTQLFFISHLIYSPCQPCIVYWRKEFLNCFDKGNLPGLEIYQVCLMHLCTRALWAHAQVAHPWSNGIFIIP